MMELADTAPDVNVQPAEYNRLLGYPRELELTGRARELSDWVRDWYGRNGRPWVYARESERLEIVNGSIRIDGATFTSKRLQQPLEQAEAHSVILVAVGAGPELEREAQKLWREEKPDEYFFLEIFGSAVVEHLTTMTGARLCGWADGQGFAVLPHYSPGYPEWDIVEQPRLLDLIRQTRGYAFPGNIDVLESGALRPKKSLLAVFGLTRHTAHLNRLTELVPCENCSFNPCQYRRTPKYAVNIKALRRWASERLSLKFREDSSVDALFRYEGTTCTNEGRPIAFDYVVKLGPRDEGYLIREQRCGPAAGDTGHTYMCRYATHGNELMNDIDREKPLLGQPLNNVFTWTRQWCAAGCYCEHASREHKWGLVLETIHYALVGQAIMPAAAFQAASASPGKRRLKAGGSQDWLPHI
jgi:hypothetical protein